MTDKPSKAELAAQIAEQSEARAARVEAQSEVPVATNLVEIIVRGAGRDAGTRREVTTEAADRLVRQGHATRA